MRLSLDKPANQRKYNCPKTGSFLYTFYLFPIHQSVPRNKRIRSLWLSWRGCLLSLQNFSWKVDKRNNRILYKLSSRLSELRLTKVAVVQTKSNNFLPYFDKKRLLQATNLRFLHPLSKLRSFRCSQYTLEMFWNWKPRKWWVFWQQFPVWGNFNKNGEIFVFLVSSTAKVYHIRFVE